MWFEYFVTRRIKKNGEKSFSRLIIIIARIAIALSLCVMIIATSLVSGFRATISDKIYGFWGHINISKQSLRNSFDDEAMYRKDEFVKEVRQIDGVTAVQVYARKAGIIKSKNDIEGIIIKGIGPDFNWDHFDKYIISGNGLIVNDTLKSRGILLSKSTADRLKFTVGDSVLLHFIDQDINGDYRQRYKRLKLEGIYNTGLEEFDKLFAITDIRHIQDLNNWGRDQIGGYEVFIDDPEKLQVIEIEVDKAADPFWEVQTIQQIIPSVFDWLNLQKVNEWIILILMLLVALINMVTSLLILILDRTHMIGILKSLGARNGSIRKIFLFHASDIILKGMLWGNVIGIGLCMLQIRFGFIRLPEESYYVSVAPVKIDVLWVLGLNAGTFIISLLFLIIPSLFVAKIKPIRAITFS